MRRSAVIFILSLLGTVMLCAQTPLEKMNSIKMSDQYFWDEYTHLSPDTATIGAVRRLLLYIDVPEDKTLTENDLMGSVKFIKMKRSALTRVFAYISKANAQALVNGQRPVTVEPEPVVVTEPDAVDSVAVVDIAPVEEVVVDTVKADPVTLFRPLPLAQELMSKTDFFAAYEHIQQLKARGVITDFGPLKDSDNLDNKYLAIFQKNTRRPVCVLSPVSTGENRTNLVAGNTDSMTNYEDGKHIAIWFNITQ